MLARTLLLSLALASTAQAQDEFLGPFASWKNVQDFGVDSDPATDDTAGIQAAINASQNVSGNTWSVLYLPEGVYRISSTITNVRRPNSEDYLGLSIIGSDPETTIIEWHGPDSGTMLNLDMWNGEFSRITLDGMGSASIGLYRGDAFSTYQEVSDVWFRDLQTGLKLGRRGNGAAGQAEVMIQRCRFLRCEEGLVPDNDNSLDVWCWWSLFEECGVAVFNRAGNVHLYENVFLRSKRADFDLAWLQTFSMVGNRSLGSKTFFDLNQFSTGGALILLKGNQVHDWTGEFALSTGRAGPFVLLDNEFRPAAGRTGPSVELSASAQFLMGNTYAVENPILVDQNSHQGTVRVREVDPKIVPREEFSALDLSLPGTPRNYVRKVYEATQGTGDDAAAIQAAIDLAAGEPSASRPVVHMAKGYWAVTRTLEVPANSGIQITGDGCRYGTVLYGVGLDPGQPLLRVMGPSRASLRNFVVDGSKGNGVLVEGVDQEGARIFLDQVQVRGKNFEADLTDTGFLFDGLDRAGVTTIGSSFHFVDHGVRVVGGASRIGMLCSLGTHTGRLFEVTEGGSLTVEAMWYERHWKGGTMVTEAQGDGDLLIAAANLSHPLDDASQPVMRVDGHDGDLALVLAKIDGNTGAPIAAQHFDLGGSGAAMRFLALGCRDTVQGRTPGGGFVDEAHIWRDTTDPPGQNSLLLSTLEGPNASHFEAGKGQLNLRSIRNRTVGDSPSDAYLRSMLEPLRYKRTEALVAGAPGSTALGMSRVLIEAGPGGTGLEIRGGAGEPVEPEPDDEPDSGPIEPVEDPPGVEDDPEPQEPPADNRAQLAALLEDWSLRCSNPDPTAKGAAAIESISQHVDFLGRHFLTTLPDCDERRLALEQLQAAYELAKAAAELRIREGE